MKLELILDRKIEIINKNEVKCPQKSCRQYGFFYRCYIPNYIDDCKFRMGDVYSEKRNIKSN